MCKSEIFAEILNLVGKETEVSTELILSSSKVTEVVDARSIVVFITQVWMELHGILCSRYILYRGNTR